jgi:hypothetical protein
VQNSLVIQSGVIVSDVSAGGRSCPEPGGVVGWNFNCDKGQDKTEKYAQNWLYGSVNKGEWPVIARHEIRVEKYVSTIASEENGRDLNG